VAVHVDVAPVPTSVHPTGLEVFGLRTGSWTRPDGGTAPLADVSVTVAVHIIGWLRVADEGVHTTVMVVGCRLAIVI